MRKSIIKCLRGWTGRDGDEPIQVEFESAEVDIDTARGQDALAQILAEVEAADE
jgi:hypothetical protein